MPSRPAATRRWHACPKARGTPAAEPVPDDDCTRSRPRPLHPTGVGDRTLGALTRITRQRRIKLTQSHSRRARVRGRLAANRVGRAMSDTITIPARRGKAAYAAAGQIIRIINTHGEQVVDTWAFNRRDMTEFMSMEH